MKNKLKTNDDIDDIDIEDIDSPNLDSELDTEFESIKIEDEVCLDIDSEFEKGANPDNFQIPTIRE